MDGGEAVQKKRKEADLESEVENEMKKITYYFIAYILMGVLFALSPKISSTVYKKGCCMSASAFISLAFQLFLFFCILEKYWYIGPFLKYLAPKNGF